MKDVSVTSLKIYDRFSDDKLRREKGFKMISNMLYSPLKLWLLSVSKIKVRLTCPSSASLPLLPSSRIFSFSPFLHSFTHRGRQKPFHFTSTGGPPFVKPDSTHTHSFTNTHMMDAVPGSGESKRSFGLITDLRSYPFNWGSRATGRMFSRTAS